MVNVPFDFGTTNTGTSSNLVETAYDQYVRVALQSVPLFRNFATVKPVAQSMPGDSVVFHIRQNLAPAITPLSEIDDPAGVSLANPTRVTVELQTYGNFTVATKLVRDFSLDNAFDASIADDIAYNMADSIDTIVQNVIATGSNVIKEVDGEISLAAGDTANGPIRAADIRYAVTKLRKNNVKPNDGQFYTAFIHPDVAHDLRVESNPAAWRTPANYVASDEIYAGELGEFEGVRFIVTPRVGVSEAGIYNTYIVGAEFLAEASVEDPTIVLNGTVVDPLNRKMTVGWRATLGWNVFRPEALWRVETTSTVADPA